MSTAADNKVAAAELYRVRIPQDDRVRLAKKIDHLFTILRDKTDNGALERLALRVLARYTLKHPIKAAEAYLARHKKKKD